jgi:hypothetical protein
MTAFETAPSPKDLKDFDRAKKNKNTKYCTKTGAYTIILFEETTGKNTY